MVPASAQDLPTLSVADAAARESGAEIDFVLGQSESASVEVTVDKASPDGTAVADDDKLPTLSVAGVTRIRATAETTSGVDTPSSAIQIVDVDVAQGGAVGVRNDCWDDAPMGASVACIDPTPESWSGLDIEIELLDSAVDFDVVIEYESMDLTATGGTDYVALDGTLTLTVGNLSGRFAIDFIDDLVEEGHEEFVVVASAPEYTDFQETHIHVTIIDEESIRVSVADASGYENFRYGMRVDITFSEVVFWGASFGVGTTAGTAGPDDDYVHSDDSISVTLRPGRRLRSLTLGHYLLDDLLDEPNETYTLFVEGHQYLSTDRASATMTILDDDDPPSVSIADASGLEDSIGDLSFDVALNTASGKEITLDYATTDDTATAGSDYNTNTGRLTFDPGDTGKSIDVTVIPDDVHESGENFNVTISNTNNVSLGNGVAVGTIQNDDARLSVSDAAASEGAGEILFLATANDLVKTDQTVTVDYATEDESAIAGSDYASKSGTLTFTSTNRTQAISVRLLDDGVDEPDERFVVNLTNATNASIGDASAFGTIRDNDETSSEITLTASPARVSEGDGATDIDVTATLDGGGRAEATEVVVSVEGGGDVDAVDFQDVRSFGITIPAGNKSGEGTFTLTPIDDNVDESNETLDVEGSSDLPVRAGTVELLDDDVPSAAILLSASPSRITEDGGGRTVEVTATLDASSRTVATTVSVSVTDTGNPDAVDYTASATAFEITIAAGATTGTETLTVTPVDDGVDKRDEVLEFGGMSDLPVTPTSVTLADDDQASSGIRLAASPFWVSEGAGSTKVMVTVTLDGAAQTAQSLVQVTVSGSGDADAVDFAAVSDFEIAIPAGEISGMGTFTLDPEDDDVDEADETLIVVGVADLPASAASQTLTLADDDAASTGILLSVSPASVSEGAGATKVTVTATLDGSARTIETGVTVSVSGSGDVDAADFETVPDFKIAIPADATTGTGTFTLFPEDDVLDEANERLSVFGTSDLPVTETALSLTDDDATSTGILLSATPATVSEGAGVTEVTVTAALDGGARNVETRVAVTVSGSGDADAVDFEAVPDFEIVIPPEATSGMETFLLHPEDDNVRESNETLRVAGTADLDVTAAVVSITDDDAASTGIALSAVPVRVIEDGGPVQVKVTAALNRAARLVGTPVTVTVSGSGAASAVDFAAVPDFEIVIAEGATNGTGTFTLTPEDDGQDEADERIAIAGTSDLPVTGTALALADDDTTSAGIVLSAAPTRVSEGAGATKVTVTATLDGSARTIETGVRVSVAGSGDAGTVGFAAVPDFEFEIPAGSARGTGTFILTPEDDALDEAEERISIVGTSDLPVTSTAVTLLDDDEVSTRVLLFLVAEPPRASEGGGPVRVTVTAQLDGGVRGQATRVAVSVSGSGNPDAVDFRPVADFEITIPAGAASGTGTFTLMPENDSIAEADETVSVSGASDLPVTPASLLLFDDDEASTRILLTTDRTRVSEGGGPVTVTVTAALNRDPRPRATTARLSVVGSGDAGAVGFAVVPDFDIVIAAGATSETGLFTLTPEDDAITEADETLTVSGVSDLPVTSTSLLLADDDEPPQQVFRILLFESTANSARQGFLRVINHSPESGEVRIDAVDDAGVRREPVMLAIDGGEAAHFNSDDLENGNAEKGLSGGVGPSSRGEWRLTLSSDLNIEVLAYARTPDGFVTTMHDSAPVRDGTHRVSFFNPGRNEDQKSLLRVVNTGTQDAEATITGTDDAGASSGEVRVAIPAGTVRTLSAAELESGVAEGIVEGALGTGAGKWRLTLYSPLPLAVKSLLTSPPGYLANLSTAPRTPGSAADTHGVLLFPSMSEPGREGVVRVVNHGAQAAQVRILAMDDTAFEYEPLTLTVAAGSAAHFNSADLELGNADKELSGSTGTGSGSWRLDLTSAQDIEVLSYVRTTDGFLTPVHDLAPVVDGAYRVAFFNPASNEAQVSRLRLINAGPTDVSVTVTGVDDAGESPASPVRLEVAAGTALEVSSAALESGDGEAIESGAFGDGEGKWRLRIVSDRPIQVMSLVDNPTRHVTNTSTVLRADLPKSGQRSPRP